MSEQIVKKEVLSSEQKEQNKQRFLSLLREAANLDEKRSNGIRKLHDWIQTTEFFDMPASTQYHEPYSGGLCEHTLKVFDHLDKLASAYKIEASRQSIILCALLHDLCKIDLYEPYMRNCPPDREHSTWHKEPSYRIKEGIVEVGHASKSIWLAMHFFILTPSECEAIFNHMSMYDESPYHKSYQIGNAFAHNSLAFLLHVADEASSYIKL